ncbi:MAG: metallophosphoesterase [Thermoanaerobacteraceae bacterium]
MNLAVISDTHGMLGLVRKGLLAIGEVDYLIHLGDNADDGIELSKEFNIPLEYVRGNCDFASKNDSEKIIDIEGKKIFLTHGHKYYVKYEYDIILERGRELGVDAIFFGHTHIPMISRHHDILLLNPGSPSLPRDGSRPTFAVAEVSKNDIKARLINLQEIKVAVR